MEQTTTTIGTLLTDVGTVFTNAISWVGDVAETIVDNPVLLMFCVAVPLVGLGVGMFKRLIHSHG